MHAVDVVRVGGDAMGYFGGVFGGSLGLELGGLRNWSRYMSDLLPVSSHVLSKCLITWHVTRISPCFTCLSSLDVRPRSHLISTRRDASASPFATIPCYQFHLLNIGFHRMVTRQAFLERQLGKPSYLELLTIDRHIQHQHSISIHDDMANIVITGTPI